MVGFPPAVNGQPRERGIPCHFITTCKPEGTEGESRPHSALPEMAHAVSRSFLACSPFSISPCPVSGEARVVSLMPVSMVCTVIVFRCVPVMQICSGMPFRRTRMPQDAFYDVPWRICPPAPF